MKLVVGLGNPGREYEGTRHNVGFEVTAALARRVDTTLSEKRFKARLGRGRLAGESITIIEPMTYMNLSGESVGPASGFYQLPTDAVIVVHDDLDLDLGRIKLKRGGGHGGHNGLRSLIHHLPDADFLRVRVGVGRPPAGYSSADYVLARFTDDERPTVDDVVRTAADAVESILKDGLRHAMTEFNRSKKKERESVSEQAGACEEATTEKVEK